MTTHSRLTLSIITTFALSNALLAMAQEASSANESPVRKAFIERDISLEQVVKETTERQIATRTANSEGFSSVQAGPGRAARALLINPTYANQNPDGLLTPMPLKTWSEHDQITIVVLESSRVERSQELDTEKDWGLAFEAAAWTDFFNAGNLFTTNSGDNLPRFEFVGAKDFDGEGDYDSKEEITFRTTATVLEVLPNGNLVLEARHTTKTDNESTVKTITGTCDPRHIAPDDTVLHWRLYDLDLNIQNNGFIKDAATKGFIAQVVDFIFAF